MNQNEIKVDIQGEEEKLNLVVRKYNEIMQRYRNGEFGDDYLTLREILKAANEENFLDNLSISETQYFINQASGFLKLMFLELMKKKLNNLEKDKELNRNLVKKI